MITSGFSYSGSTTQFVHNYARNNDKLAISIEQLSTGKRINRPADDPAGFIAAEQIRGELIQLRSERKVDTYRRVAVRQQQSALSNIGRIVNNVRGDVVTAADGTLDTSQRVAIQEGVDSSLDAIDRITSQVDGIDGTDSLGFLRSGGADNLVDGDLQQAINVVDETAQSISTQQAALGSYERTQLDVFEVLRQDKEVILTEALSQIEDTDFAVATAELAQSQVLVTASMAALAYASQQMVEQMSELMETVDVTAE